MSKFVNLGKRSESVAIAAPEKENNEVYYPKLYLDDVDLGKIVGQDDLGKEMEATVKLKLTSITVNEKGGGKQLMSGHFDILAIKV